MLSGSSLRQTVHTHHASVHKAAKLVAAFLRVARVTAGLMENNGSLPPGLWLTSPTGGLPRNGISSGSLCSAIEYWLPWPFLPRFADSRCFQCYFIESSSNASSTVAVCWLVVNVFCSASNLLTALVLSMVVVVVEVVKSIHQHDVKVSGTSQSRNSSTVRCSHAGWGCYEYESWTAVRSLDVIWRRSVMLTSECCVIFCSLLTWLKPQKCDFRSRCGRMARSVVDDDRSRWRRLAFEIRNSLEARSTGTEPRRHW